MLHRLFWISGIHLFIYVFSLHTMASFIKYRLCWNNLHSRYHWGTETSL